MVESKYKSLEDKDGYVCPNDSYREDTSCGISVDKALEAAVRESTSPLSMAELKRVVFAGSPQKAQSEWDIEKTVELLIRDGRVGKCGSGYVLARGRKDVRDC